MSNPVLSRLETWLRQQVTISNPRGDVARIEVRHLPMGSKSGNEVATFDVPKVVDDGWFESVAQSMFLSAETDSDNMPGKTQRYMIAIYRGKGDKIDARHVLPPFVREDDDDNVGDSEPPTTKGILGQLMRHVESSNRMIATMTGTIVTAQQRTINRLSEQNEKLQSDRVSMFETMEELASAKQDREIERMKAEGKQKAIAEVIPTAKLLLGTIAHKMTGGGGSDGPNATQVQLAAILSSLTDEQREKLLGILKPEQMIALGELMPSEQGEH